MRADGDVRMQSNISQPPKHRSVRRQIPTAQFAADISYSPITVIARLTAKISSPTTTNATQPRRTLDLLDCRKEINAMEHRYPARGLGHY